MKKFLLIKMKRFLLLILVVFGILLVANTIDRDEVPAQIVKQKEIQQVDKIPKIEFGKVKNKSKFIKFIIYCVEKNVLAKEDEHYIPIEIVVAQAIHESAWGNSRFSKEANNLFGIRTWNANVDQIKPQGRKNAPWGIIKFKDKCGSVDYYYHLLNHHDAYDGFRKARNKMVANDNVDPLFLVQFLSLYSELGKEYILRLQKSIRQLREEYPWLEQY